MEESNHNPATGVDAPSASPHQETQRQQCASLLEISLSAARLPAAAENSLRSRFSGSIFEAAALQQAISDTRALISDLTAAALSRARGR